MLVSALERAARAAFVPDGSVRASTATPVFSRNFVSTHDRIRHARTFGETMRVRATGSLRRLLAAGEQRLGPGDRVRRAVEASPPVSRLIHSSNSAGKPHSSRTWHTPALPASYTISEAAISSQSGSDDPKDVEGWSRANGASSAPASPPLSRTLFPGSSDATNLAGSESAASQERARSHELASSSHPTPAPPAPGVGGRRLDRLWDLAKSNALSRATEAELAAAGVARGVVDDAVRRGGDGPAAMQCIMQNVLEAGAAAAASLRRDEAQRHMLAERAARMRRAEETEVETFLNESLFARGVLALEERGIELDSACLGQHRATCPSCEGGSTGERSLSVALNEEGATWLCHRATCGWSGGQRWEEGSAGLGSGAPAAGEAPRPRPHLHAEVHAASTGSLSARRRRQAAPPTRPDVALEPLSPVQLAFFASRGISEEVLASQGVASGPQDAIAFAYTRGGELINVKFRALDKRFWQVRGAEKILYGLDGLGPDARSLVIVEGEMDKLSMDQAGVPFALSVPDGAPARVKEAQPAPLSLPSAAASPEDVKFSYLWACRDVLDGATRVVLATDNDPPGDALAEELARRLGRERCWRVRWPSCRADHEALLAKGRELLRQDGHEAGTAEETGLSAESPPRPSPPASPVLPSSPDAWHRKDANEVLVKDGPEALRAFVRAAEPLPIRGLLRVQDYLDEVLSAYQAGAGSGAASSTGWPSLDEHYRVVPGELTVVTGVPNSGKSEWLDALLCNLSCLNGWTFAMCSMEKRASDHARQLAEKVSGLPFYDMAYGQGTPRMTLESLEASLDWLDDRFHLIRCEDDALPSVEWVLSVARAAVYRHGIRGLVIDPYNELDHRRPGGMSETEYVSAMLTQIKRFAQAAGVHVWFVAHPKQLQAWKGEPPSLYDISGSAHFINKADCGIVVHRPRDPDRPTSTDVHIMVRKMRNKVAGSIGQVTLVYDRVNGRYIDPRASPDAVPPTSRPVSRPSAPQGGPVVI